MTKTDSEASIWMIQDKTGSIMGPYTHDDFLSMLDSLEGKEGIRVCLPYTFWISLEDEETFSAFKKSSEEYRKKLKKNKARSWEHFPELREDCSSPNQSSGEITQMIIPAQLEQKADESEKLSSSKTLSSSEKPSSEIMETEELPKENSGEETDLLNEGQDTSWIRIKSPEAVDQKASRKAELIVTFVVMLIGLALAGFIFFQTS